MSEAGVVDALYVGFLFNTIDRIGGLPRVPQRHLGGLRQERRSPAEARVPVRVRREVRRDSGEAIAQTLPSLARPGRP